MIAGKVTDADGDPVRYAQVEALQYDYVSGKRQLQRVGAAQTNDRGEYRMFHLRPGHYYVRAEFNGGRSGPMGPTLRRAGTQVRGVLPSTTLAAAYYPGVADPARATELDAQPGAELDGIDLRLAPEKRYSIRGKVGSGDTAKLRTSIRVVPRSANPERPQFAMMVMRDSYEVPDVAPGSYIVTGDMINPDKPEERQYARQPVDVVDRDVDGVDLVFSPGIQVKGAVKVEGSEPLPLENMMVVLQAADLTGAAAKVAADGTFVSPEIAPGIYRVRIVGGRAVYLKSVRVGDREIPEKQIDAEHLSGPITVVAGADFGRVEGTVTDEAGKPVYNADVTLIPDQSRPDWEDRFRSMFTQATGKFTLANVPPGEYKAFAWLGVEPGAPQSAEFRKPYEDRGVAVKVEANGKLSVDLKAIVLTTER